MKAIDQAHWTSAFEKLRETNETLYAALVAGLDQESIHALFEIHRQALTDYIKIVEEINAPRP